MIQSLLIANRGEIACRIIRTARRMGIRTVAVYSDADARAQHTAQADEAVHIGASPAAESYLRGEKIIAAARATGAQAIHPGYGFLSENAAFAQAVIDAGLIWVGPNPASITAMGLKDAAKKLMADAGVPVTPGYMGDNQEPAFLAEQAAQIGYPVLIKAVAGGGGKGMRKVEAPADFADALASCQREATASFGNAHVLIEKYIQHPRHIEVQVFGDTHGNIVHLFERDCSLQRRHQKVIEEAPAPGMDEATRAALCAVAVKAAALCAVAVKAAAAVHYVGAGTIEFIADASDSLRADRIWFMEMNTRLQVEHPVTEEITGVDLVEWQLRVASGEALPLKQDELHINGWAIEARLYAEDPAKGFLPSIGRLELLQLGEVEGGRIDTGVCEGGEVTPFYDPMIAKLIAHADTRDGARARLATTLAGCAVYPVKTNASFLVKALAHPAFVAGDVDTGLIGRDGDAMCVPSAPSPAALTRAAMTIVHEAAHMGFRLNAPASRQAAFLLDNVRVDVEIDGPGAAQPIDSALVTDQGTVWQLSPFRAHGSPHGPASSGNILAPMPGKVIAIDIAVGQVVTKGQKLVTLEAMKMEHSLTAPFAGTIVALNATLGAQISEGTLLIQINAKSNGEDTK